MAVRSRPLASPAQLAQSATPASSSTSVLNIKDALASEGGLSGIYVVLNGPNLNMLARRRRAGDPTSDRSGHPQAGDLRLYDPGGCRAPGDGSWGGAGRSRRVRADQLGGPNGVPSVPRLQLTFRRLTGCTRARVRPA